MTDTSVGRAPWSVLSLIQWSADYLSSKEFESPRLTAELLLCHVLNCRRIELYTNFDKILTEPQLALFKSHIKRRLAHEPVQYIVGSAEFMGLRFEVDSRTLIPRPETEVLVEQVVEHARARKAGSLRVLDVGTGSGNIAVSLAKFLPEAEIVGLDISAHALEVAGRNVTLHGVGDRVRVLQKDILGETDYPELEPFDYLVSNPPYIAESEMASLAPEIREYEPLLALRAEGDGLGYFRRIAAAGKRVLNSGGWLFTEIGFGQHLAVEMILSDAGYAAIGNMKDYGGIERVVKAQLLP